jgi:hypothetical protein
MHVPVHHRVSEHAGDPGLWLMPSGGSQIVEDPQRARRRHSPRQHVLAADPIFESGPIAGASRAKPEEIAYRGGSTGMPIRTFKATG